MVLIDTAGSSDDLEIGQVLDNALEGFALVNHDLASLAGFGVDHGDGFLARSRLANGAGLRSL